MSRNKTGRIYTENEVLEMVPIIEEVVSGMGGSELERPTVIPTHEEQVVRLFATAVSTACPGPNLPDRLTEAAKGLRESAAAELLAVDKTDTAADTRFAQAREQVENVHRESMSEANKDPTTRETAKLTLEDALADIELDHRDKEEWASEKREDLLRKGRTAVLLLKAAESLRLNPGSTDRT